jgi:hypothetical protein
MKETSNCPYCGIALVVDLTGANLPCSCGKLKYGKSASLGDEVQENANALLGLLAQHPAIHVRFTDLDKWRPVVPTAGTLRGLEHLGEVTCVCTDGVLAWFLREDGWPFHGHVGWFNWTTAITAMVPYRKADGSMGYFKQVRDSGAPSALHGKPKAHREPKASVKPKSKSRKAKLQELMDSI